jgi:hypothetical protein
MLNDSEGIAWSERRRTRCVFELPAVEEEEEEVQAPPFEFKALPELRCNKKEE